MANKFTAKALLALNVVINMFRDPNKLAENCARATFDGVDMPSSKWTLRNRWLAMFQTGEADCRGFNQWKKVGRHVKKGSKSAFILAPLMVPVKENGQTKRDSNGKPLMRCIGFKNVSVFSVNDTDGKPLAYENPQIINKLPLIDVAQSEGLKVTGRPFDGSTYGWCAPTQGTIAVCTEDEKTFLHELTHWFDNKLSKASGGKGLKGGQHWDQEIVAELGGAVLARMYGKTFEVNQGTYGYIKTYANSNNMDVLDACLAVLNRTAKVVSAIMDAAEKEGVEAATKVA